jgi:enoyl-CoA hydratase
VPTAAAPDGTGHDRVMTDAASPIRFTTYDDFEHLRFDRPEPGVLLITIDRPEVLNAADERLHREFSQVWGVVDADDSVAVSVVTGAGRAFSAGGDLAMVERMTTDHAAVVEQWTDAKAVVDAMVASVKPIVSAINGVAVGAGLAVALLADVSIMAESARLSDGHTRLGVAAGDHAALLWPLLCGMAKARYYLLTADFVAGPEAERIGLVTRCVPDADVLPEALAIAGRLARGSRTAVQWTKRVLNQWLVAASPAFGESLALEMLGFLGPDAREGVAAVQQRRAPEFPSAAANG